MERESLPRSVYVSDVLLGGDRWSATLIDQQWSCATKALRFARDRRSTSASLAGGSHLEWRSNAIVDATRRYYPWTDPPRPVADDVDTFDVSGRNEDRGSRCTTHSLGEDTTDPCSDAIEQPEWDTNGRWQLERRSNKSIVPTGRDVSIEMFARWSRWFPRQWIDRGNKPSMHSTESIEYHRCLEDNWCTTVLCSETNPSIANRHGD